MRVPKYDIASVKADYPNITIALTPLNAPVVYDMAIDSNFHPNTSYMHTVNTAKALVDTIGQPDDANGYCPNKIEMIKCLRQITSIGLKPAKDLIEMFL